MVHLTLTLRLDQVFQGRSFATALARESKGKISELLVVRPGRNGGTYARWQIALANAKWLSPELYMAVNEIYMRYKTGLLEPRSAVSREAVDAPMSQGSSSATLPCSLSSPLTSLKGLLGKTIIYIWDQGKVLRSDWRTAG